MLPRLIVFFIFCIQFSVSGRIRRGRTSGLAKPLPVLVDRFSGEAVVAKAPIGFALCRSWDII